MKTIILDDSTPDILATLNKMRAGDHCCDATLCSEDGRSSLRVHRVVMATSSPYFRTLFTTSLSQVRRDVIVVPNVSGAILELLVEYAYSDRTLVSEDNVEELLKAADQFDVKKVVGNCCRFIEKRIDAENCLGIWRMAKAYFCKQLEERAFRYIVFNFPAVVSNSEELGDLPMDHLQEILQSDYLNAPCETLGWRAVIRWCQQDPSMRMDRVPALLTCLRLVTMPLAALQSVLEHPFVWRNCRCNPVVSKLMCCILKDSDRYDDDVMDGRQTPVKRLRQIFVPRLPQKVILCFGGWSEYGPTDIVEVYDSKIDYWNTVSKASDPAGARAYHMCLSLDKYIYIIGGTQGLLCLNSCRRLDTITRTWEEIAPMNCKRCYLCATVLDGTIYAIGGFDGESRLSSVEAYDKERNQWTCVAPMHIPRSDASACSFDGRLYVTGGFDGEDYLKTVECYSPQLDQWTKQPSMNCCRSGVRCVIDRRRKKLFALGGFDGNERLNSAERLDLGDGAGSGQWVAVRGMAHRRSNFAVEIMNNKIYVMGGFDSETTTDVCESYDLATHRWKKMAPLKFGRSALAACVQVRMPNVRDYLMTQSERATANLSRTESQSGS